VGVQVAGTALFAVSTALAPALAGRWLRNAAVSVSWPVTRAWLNRSIPSSATRATSLSIMGQADAAGQVVGGPAFGLYANRLGIQAALLLSVAAQAPAVWLLARLRR